MYRILIATLVLGLVAACASNGDGLSKRPGYQEVQISALRYRVAYRGHGEDLPDTIDRTVFRAAELTLSQGYDWFDVTDIRAGYITAGGAFLPEDGYGRDRIIRRDCAPMTCRESLYAVRQDAEADSRKRPDQSYTVVEIRIGKGVRPASLDVHDARWVLTRLND